MHSPKAKKAMRRLARSETDVDETPDITRLSVRKACKVCNNTSNFAVLTTYGLCVITLFIELDAYDCLVLLLMIWKWKIY